ncbi:MAG: DUF2634 domain-containing protein [Clostridium sp.]
MTPEVNLIVSEVDEVYSPSKTYSLDLFNGRILNKIDEIEAMKQAILKVLQTERFENVIYDDEYGVEIKRFIGKSKDFVISDLERTIKEAIEVDDRVLGISDFNIINDSKSILKVSFTVDSVYGDFDVESEVEV